MEKSTLAEDLAAFAGIKGMVVLVRLTHPLFATPRIKVVLEGDELRFLTSYSCDSPLVVKVPDGESPEAALAAACAGEVRRRAMDAACEVAMQAAKLAAAREKAAKLDAEAVRFEAYAAHLKGGAA